MRNPHSDVNDLVTLDPELYRNLMFMRDYQGDFADLALTFTTADSALGQSREVCSFHVQYVSASIACKVLVDCWSRQTAAEGMRTC